MNLSAVTGLRVRPIAATWHRAVHPQYLPTALSYHHTRLYASRYCEGPTAAAAFDILYFAENPTLALFEVGAQFGSPLTPGGIVANPSRSWLTITAQIRLTRVADLTDVAGSQVALSTTAQELTGDWLGYRYRSSVTSVSGPSGVAPTQELGAALHASSLFEGFLAISAKMPYAMVLGVFPDRIDQINFVRYSYSDAEGQTQVLQIP